MDKDSDDFEILETKEQSMKRQIDEQSKVIITLKNNTELLQKQKDELEF